jgi:hypothetical protein
MTKDASLMCGPYDNSSKSDISSIEFLTLNVFGNVIWVVKASVNLLANLYAGVLIQLITGRMGVASL